MFGGGVARLEVETQEGRREGNRMLRRQGRLEGVVVDRFGEVKEHLDEKEKNETE